jgi:broad specificity phosphatase PhoE
VTRLILCRHAETGNAAQAEELAEALAGSPLAAVYASPLARALDTARAIAARHGMTPVRVRDLREIDFGDVEGLSFDAYPSELQAELLRDPTSARFPGGETYGELKTRVSRTLAEIISRHPDGAIAVVTHSGPIRAALGAWLGMPDEATFRLDQRFAAVNVVDWIEGVPLLRLVNGLASPAAVRAAL